MSKEISLRKKAELVSVGSGRNEELRVSTLQFNSKAIAEFIAVKSKREWIPIRKLSRTAYGNGSPSNQTKARKRLYELFNCLLSEYAEILVYEFTGRKVTAVKLFDPSSEEDRQAITPKIQKMAKLLQWRDEQYKLVMEVVGRRSSQAERESMPLYASPSNSADII